jgi:tetratricopeptide (TPR) repeat protein
MYVAKITTAMLCWSLVTFNNPFGFSSPGDVLAKVGTTRRQSNQSSLPDGQTRSPNQHLQRQLVRARHLLKSGSLQEAIAILKELVERVPDNKEAQLLLGTALALVPMRSEALAAFDRAVKLQPNSAPTYHAFGVALARFAELEDAIRMFRKALEFDPDLADAHVNLALLLAQQKQTLLARDHLIKAVGIQRQSKTAAYTRYLLATVLMELKELDRALQEIDLSIRLRPDFADAHLTLGLIRKQQIKSDDALKAFQESVRLSPGHPLANYELGVAYLRKGRATEAIAPLQKAFELRSSNRTVLYQLCQALRRAGRAEESAACHEKLSRAVDEKIAAEQGMNSGVLNNEGIELEKAGDLEGALQKYQSAVEIDPFEPTLRRNLALALCRLGRWNDGVAELKEVLRINPEDVEATKALYIAIEHLKAAHKNSSVVGKPRNSKP